MSHKKQLGFVFVIVAVILAAVFTSFGINLLLRKTPSVQLPNAPSSTDPSQTDGLNGPVDEYGFLHIDVTPESVQEVIRTLSRPASYHQDITIQLLGGDTDSPVTSASIWKDGKITRVECTPPTGLTQYNLLDSDTLYRWYGSSSRYVTVSAAELSSDLVQHVPTYEDVLTLDPAQITGAGYEVKESYPCIYVEVTPAEHQTDRYWISIQNGLLLGAERYENDALVYSMASYQPLETPCPADADFSLPDGTVLHSVSR